METEEADAIMELATVNSTTEVSLRMEAESKRDEPTNAKRPRLEKAPPQPATRREGEAELFTQLSEEQWVKLEDGLQHSEMQIVFSMTEQSAQVGNFYMRLKDLDRDILDKCRACEVAFEDNMLYAVGTQEPILVGNPASRTRALWCLLKKGYIDVRGVQIWIQPSFTGRMVSNLSMNELEYQNVNEARPTELVRILQRWGATDVVVVSHANNMGTKGKMPAILCLNSISRTTPDLLFAFRLFFPSENEATTVFANYLNARKGSTQSSLEIERTIALKTVSNVSWDRKRGGFFRPSGAEYAEAAEKQIKIFGLTVEITAQKLEDALKMYGFPAEDVQIQGSRRNWAVAEMRTKSQVDELLKSYGPEAKEKIRLGNHTLRCVKADNPQERLCFQCHKPGHYKFKCPDLNHAASYTMGTMDRGGYGGFGVSRAVTELSVRGSSESGIQEVVGQMVETRTAQLEKKLDKTLALLADRISATEANQQAVDQRVASFADNLQQKITSAVQSAVQASMAHMMHQWRVEPASTPDFHQGLPSHQ